MKRYKIEYIDGFDVIETVSLWAAVEAAQRIERAYGLQVVSITEIGEVENA
jgi:hypothetical protein